jgi:hypothetical protein
MDIQLVTWIDFPKTSSCFWRESHLQNVRWVMRRFAAVTTLCVGLLFAEQALGQTVDRTVQSTPRHVGPASCLILERMGAADQVASQVMSFGIHRKEFHYVEGRLPEGFSFQDKLSGRDVRDLQGRGSEIIILNSDYLPDELEQARSECRAETRRMPLQATTVQIEISSTPQGSDIELDGKFIGSTPSIVKVSLGEHTLKLVKEGYAIWEREITTVPGTVRISPDLEPLANTFAKPTPQTAGSSDSY